MTIAAMRRRGMLALLAGLVLLIGVPFYQATWLWPAGYVALHLDSLSSFGAYLGWAAAHPWLAVGSRVVLATPFLLALAVPGPLRLILWGEDRTQGRSPMLLGLVGFGLFAIVLLLGVVVVPGIAHNYLAHIADRAGIARGYHTLYEFETVAATVLGLGMIALALAMMSLRGIATGQVPPWYGYVGLATSGLLAATAVFALFGLSTAVAQVQQFSLPALALWLIVSAAVLLRVQARPRPAAVERDQGAPVEPATPAG